MSELTKDQQTIAEIKAAVTNFMKTFNQGNPNEVAKLYSKDCILIVPGQKVIRGREGAQQLWHTMIKEVGMTDIEYEIIDILPFSETFAAELTTFTAKINGVKQSGGYCVNWRKENGQWFLHQDVFNAEPVAA